MTSSSQSTANQGVQRRYVFDPPEVLAVSRQLYRPFGPQVPHACNNIFDFMSLPAELRDLVYSYTVTPLHDPDYGRVYLGRQRLGEYRAFTGLPLVCKAIYKEYTATLTRNTTVAVRAEDVGAYIETAHPDRNDALKHGDIQVSYIAHGRPFAWDILDARIQEAREADEVDEVDEADDADDADEDGCHGDEVVECNDLAASSYNPAPPRATTMASDDLPTARSKSCD
ncbi:hypothetical protein PMIN05_008020 [Paraphaeosphaeria minitans]